MKRRVVLIVLIALFIVALIGCLPRPVQVELPPHQLSYTPGCLKGEGVKLRILELQNIDLDVCPHLRVREGFTLHRAIYAYSGGDVIGFLVAVHEASKTGFAEGERL